MAILLLKSTTEPKCPKALPFCSPPRILQTQWLTWEAIKHNCSHTQQLNLMLLQGSWHNFFFSTCTAQWKCLGDVQTTFLGRSSAVITCCQKSPSPVLSQPWLGHQISFSSLAGVLHHHHFLPQPSLPLEFPQVEISSTPAPCRQIPSAFTVEPTG